MRVVLGQEYTWNPTTDEFRVRVVRELGSDEVDPEVGPMYEITVHAYADELSPATTTYEGLLGELANILYPMDQYRDECQWNGGDVCDALARLLDKYLPYASTRQPERPDDEHPPTCDICGVREEDSPLTWDGETGLHHYCQERYMTCPRCGGAGATGANGPDPDSCSSCRGTGWVNR